MELTLALFLLIIGFGFLVLGADKFVEGASAIACKLGIPPLLVGLTIVAFGTSAPELTVSITAGLQQANEIVISNVLGSNIFNLLMVIGVSSLISPLVIEKEVLNREWVYSIVATIVLLVALLDGQISRIDGIILLAGLTFVMTTQIKSALDSRKPKLAEETIDNDNIVSETIDNDTVITETVEQPNDVTEVDNESDDEEEEIEGINPNLTNPITIIAFVLLGLGAIVFGGNLVVDSATTIALLFGVSETLIGLTIVAIGTSLPELVTAVVGVKRGENDIVVGNAIGSNLFNVLLILGVSTTINPIPVISTVIVDAIFLLAISIVLLFLAKKGEVKRNLGSVMILLYVLYTIFIIIRQ